MTTALAATIGLAGSAVYFSPLLWRHYRMNRIRREVVKNRILALTYDDGPSGALTPQLLDLLHKRSARATFFMLGRSAQLHPDMAERVMREGHDVGCHSDQHLNAWESLPWQSIADIDAGYKRLSPWILPDGMFRPPHGKMTLPTYWSDPPQGRPCVVVDRRFGRHPRRPSRPRASCRPGAERRRRHRPDARPEPDAKPK